MINHIIQSQNKRCKYDSICNSFPSNLKENSGQIRHIFPKFDVTYPTWEKSYMSHKKTWTRVGMALNKKAKSTSWPGERWAEKLTVSWRVNLLRKFFNINFKPLLHLQRVKGDPLIDAKNQKENSQTNQISHYQTWLRTSESDAEETNVMASPLVPNLPALPT